jgi:teichuronic acid biosynthesis protein TuaE
MQQAATLTNPQETRSPLLKNIFLVLTALTAFAFFMPISLTFNTLLLTLLLVLTMFIHLVPGRKLRLDGFTAEAYVFFLLWLIYSMLGLFWAYDQQTTVRMLLNISLYFIIFIIIGQLLQSRIRQQQMVVFLQLMFVSYLLVFIWELLTGNHLPTSRLYGTSLPIPTGPFFNENNTSTLCLMILPFLTVDSILNRKKWVKALLILAVLAFWVITIIQGARIVFLVLTIYLVLYGSFKASVFSRLVAISLLTVSLLIFVNLFPRVVKVAGMYVRYQYSSLFDEKSSVSMTSLKIRERLFQEGFEIASGSAFLGVGAGNFEDRMRSGRYHQTAWILNAHNFWMELLVNYGVFFLIGMLYFYIRWLVRLRRQARHCIEQDRQFYSACFLALVFFIPMTIIPSTLRWFYPAWFFLAAMHAVGSNTIPVPDQSPLIQTREEYEY